MRFPRFPSSPPAGPDDAILCRAILAGDSEAFATLAERYRRRIFALGYGFFKNADDTEDFVQDVLVKVYLSLPGFRGESRFSTWLMRIAYNAAVNSVRRKREYTTLADDFEIVDPGETPEERHVRESARRSIGEAVAALPERYRVCVDLYFYQDMPYGEISEVTGLPVNTIKSHVFRAKKLLAEQLKDET